MIRDGRLIIFQNFEKDLNLLPKTDEDKVFDSSNSLSLVVSEGEILDRELFILNKQDILLRQYAEYVYSQNRTIINWLRLMLVKILVNNSKTKKVYNAINIEKFFENVKITAKRLNILDDDVKFYENKILKAKENGQKALVEYLIQKKDVILRELKMLEIGDIKYIEEKDVVEFYKKTKHDSHLRLSWIKNYTRDIPDDIINRKKEFDKKYCFDNYVILHFDPNGDGDKMTKDEIERAKDPILFGVIERSTKLYYIGDWVDEYCDLTLDEFLETIKKTEAETLSKSNIIN